MSNRADKSGEVECWVVQFCQKFRRQASFWYVFINMHSLHNSCKSYKWVRLAKIEEDKIIVVVIITIQTLPLGLSKIC
jgi:hypothetical protein